MKPLTVTHLGETEKGRMLAIGEKVHYCGHLPGAAVKIRFEDGTEDVAHPACFDDLR